MARQKPQQLQVTRTIELPDPMRISRYARAPELGPRVLFFSGGTALNGLSRLLKAYTHNSIHLVTPFDSGGSSAALRRAFDMPAIGDLRNRLMALADESVLGNPEVYQLFNHRLSTADPQRKLRKTLAQMVQGEHELVADIPSPMRELICTQLEVLASELPAKFDLRRASIGNLILAGGYLTHGNNLDATLFLFSKLVSVRGTVRSIVNDNAHLVAVLEDGSLVKGQHRITGKEQSPIDKPIKSIHLSTDLKKPEPLQVRLRRKNQELIAGAELVCYAPGSFYSSLIANLMPSGVGRALARNNCPKVYIPNLGSDPEQFGMSFEATVRRLLEHLERDSKRSVTSSVLNYVLVDTQNGQYPFQISRGLLRDLGVELIDVPLVSKKSAPYYDNRRLLEILMSLI